MKTLFIDTHLFDVHILLLGEKNIIREKHILGEKCNSIYLLPSIKEVCEGQIYDQIIVVQGPGSFTGVRLGVTIAKTLAYTQNIPIKTLSSLDLLAFSDNGKKYTYGIFDGNGYYIATYDNFKRITEYEYLNNSIYKESKKEIKTNVATDYLRILEHSKTLQYVNPHSIKPLYVKLIGVENDKRN